MSKVHAGSRGPFAVASMMAVGAAAGAAFGYVGMRIFQQAGPSEIRLTWSDLGGFFLAALLAVQGLAVLALSLNRGSAGQALGGGDEARPASPQQLSFYRQQGVVLLLAGLMLAAPVAADLVEISAGVRIGLMAGILVCFGLQTVLNFIVWRRSDEFLRRLISETGNICFWLLQGLLFLWAAAERLALAPPVSAWDCVVVLMAIYLIASGFIGVRNGVGA